MEDKRFDSLTKALASGANRRSVLKGLLGLGAATVTGGVLLDDGAEAARRPAPTPTPHKCPGNQTWNGTKCVCPTGLSQCVPGTGPACCNDQNVDPGEPGFSTCCDNACCQGTCYDEERCCATNSRPGEQLPTNRICETTLGDECCLYSDVCCVVDGCCATVCTGGSSGADNCCSSDDFCPGGSESPDLCCAGNTTCCEGGTNDNACVDLSQPAQCCIDSDCFLPPPDFSPCTVGTCVEHVCQYTDCASGSICCPDNGGDYVCRVGDECCLTNQDCADTCEACVNFVCVDDPVTIPCGPTSDPDKYCCPGTNYSLCCGATQYECCGVDSAGGVTRECDADGKCCEADTPNFCAGNNTCCAAACIDFGGAGYCCDPAVGRICPNATSAVCCPNGQACSADGECCPAGTVACGDECCPVDNICCPVIAAAFVPVSAECCPSVTQCTVSGQCCPAGSTVCDGECCSGETPKCCNGVCVADAVECCNAENPCDGECESCVDGACVDDQDKCFGACGVCVDGTCQGDVTLCLACETCQFDPQTNTGTCVNDCTGCAECQASQINPAGNCFPLDSECLSCQVCKLNDTGGTCENHCDGCGNCVRNPETGDGVCVADSALCPVTDPAQVCCPAGDTFTCEAGPNCGCDPACTGCATCVDNVCIPGDCGIVCYGCEIQPDGVNGICKDTCTGCTECRIDGGVYACRPKFGNPCLACQTCEVNPDGSGGTCVSYCTGSDICCTEGGGADCCQQGLCVEGAGCCPVEDICGLVCCEANETCCSGTYCVDTTSDQQNCGACGVSCIEPPLVCLAPNGACVDGVCVYADFPYGTSCGVCLICDGAGGCIGDPACACSGVGGSCSGFGQDGCCDGLLCNGTTCEQSCVTNPTADCLCGGDSIVCPDATPCCKGPGGSPTRCNSGDGNCLCSSDATCTSKPFGNKDFCCENNQGDFVCDQTSCD